MVSTLHRYVVRELVRSFLLAFFALMIIMLLGGIYKPLRLGMSVGHLVRMLPYILPYALPWVIPASLLTGCVMTYGRLAADNELTATAASGLPLRYMCYPAFAVAAVVAAASLPMTARLIPHCRTRQKEIIREWITDSPLAIGMLSGQETIELGQFRLFVVSIEGDILRKVLVIAPMQEEGGEGSAGSPDGEKTASRRVQIYRADEARYTVDTENNVIRIEFKDARYTIVTPNESASGWLDLKADEQTILIPIGEGVKRIYPSRSERYSHELWQEAAEQEKIIGDPASTPRVRKRARRRRAATLAEAHRREALAFSPFVLCLVGVPLGIFIRRESKLASFAVAVLVFLVHYALLVGGEALATEQKLPPRAALWASDVLMALLGFGLLLYHFRR